MSQDNQQFEGLAILERVRLMRDGLIQYGGFLVSGVVGIVVVPIMLHGLGNRMYGLWVAMSSLIAVAGMIDFGLGWTVMRMVSASPGEPATEQTLISAARTVFLLIGAVGGALISIAGLTADKWILMSGVDHRIVVLVFVGGGIGFAANALIGFAKSALQGQRRFDLVTLVSGSYSIVWCVSIVVAFASGATILSIAGIYATLSVGTAALALILSRSVAGGIFDWRVPNFRLFGSQLGFSIASQLAALLTAAVAELGPLMIGNIAGASSIVPYQIGRKFPIAVALVGWSACAVLFPAGSEARGRGRDTSRETLKVGMRWVVVTTAPLCVVLYILAPYLIRLWIGSGQSEAVSIMRILTLSVLVASQGDAAFYFLWGSGEASTVAAVGVVEVALYLSVGTLLISSYGAIGAAWTTLVVLTLGSLATASIASKRISIRIYSLVINSYEGVVVPLLLCAVVLSALVEAAAPISWLMLIAYAALGTLLYVTAFYGFGSRLEERALIAELVRLPSERIHYLVRRVLRLAESSPG